MDNEEQVEGGDPRTPGISAATIAKAVVGRKPPNQPLPI